VFDDGATGLMRVVFFSLAFLALTALGIMIFRRRKYDADKVSKRIKELQNRLGKLK